MQIGPKCDLNRQTPSQATIASVRSLVSDGNSPKATRYRPASLPSSANAPSVRNDGD